VLDSRRDGFSGARTMSSITRLRGPGGDVLRDRYRRDLLVRNVLRLGITYLAPLVLLTVYFHVQYSELSRRGRLLHLGSVAEHHANVLDLFLRERVVNLLNLIDDPKLPVPPSSTQLEGELRGLRRDSETFVDLGFIDGSGVQQAYRGPFPFLENDSTFDLRARRAHAFRIRPERSDCAIDEAARARRRTGPIGAPA
jgi:hypothetical protein